MFKKAYIVNAFSSEPGGGNPAGVVVDAVNIETEKMQEIAKQLGYSETAFVLPGSSNFNYEVRFFTPVKEVDLCGHATIATFYTLVRKGIIEGPFEGTVIIKQKTVAGILPVELEFRMGTIANILMTQSSPKYGYEIANIDYIANIMGITSSEIGIDNMDLLPQLVSTGLFDIMLPVKNRNILDRINPEMENLAEYSKSLGVTGIHAFTIENTNNPVVFCRNFAPAFGIPEEAATGTANGAMGAYLIKNEVFDLKEKLEIISIQGIKMGRPSRILVNLKGKKDNLVIKVGGIAAIIDEIDIDI